MSSNKEVTTITVTKEVGQQIRVLAAKDGVKIMDYVEKLIKEVSDVTNNNQG